MKDSASIYRKIINYMYLSMCKTVDRLPFSGRYWLEQMIMGVAEYFLDEYGAELAVNSQKPGDICRAYLGLLDHAGAIKAGDYRVWEDGDAVLINVDRNLCIYREYCLQAKTEGISVYCVRLGALQAILKRTLGLNYSISFEVDEKNQICQGKLLPATAAKKEIVTREDGRLKIAGQRAILQSQGAYASFLMSIKEHAPHVLKQVLYDAGYRSAYELAQKARSLYPRLEECLQVLFDEMKNEGLGNVELVSLDPPAARATIRCYDSFQVSTVQNYGPVYRTPQVVCDLLRGTFAAYLTVLFGREIICEEMNCQAVGGNFCEFLALPFPEENAIGEGVPWVKG